MTKTKKKTLVNGTLGTIESNRLVQQPWPIEAAPPVLRKLDFGSGPNVRAGFEGVDQFSFDGKVTHVMDVRVTPWPWPDNSVSEAHCSHFLEHLTNLNGAWERVKFFNELYRVLVPGGQCQLILPYWCSARYYGDPTHKEPFSEWGLLYLNREWRLGNPAKNLGANAPHADIQYNPNGYSCDFDWTQGYNMHNEIALKSDQARQYALTFYKEAAQDMLATISARK